MKATIHFTASDINGSVLTFGIATATVVFTKYTQKPGQVKFDAGLGAKPVRVPYSRFGKFLMDRYDAHEVSMDVSYSV